MKKMRNFILMLFAPFVFLTGASCQNPEKSNEQALKKRCAVYFTFDDGPLNGSENIDSVILAEKLKISVFLVGEHVEKSRQMDNYFKYYEENPYIDEYNHSFSHANNHYKEFYDDSSKAIADIEKNQAFLKLPFRIVRLPGRNMWRINGLKKDDGVSGASTADGLAAAGYTVVGWDIEWQHNSDGTPIQSVEQMDKEINQMCNNGNTFTKNNIVVLVHDEMFQKPWEESELKELIDKLRSEDKFEFEQMRFYPQ